MYWLSKEKLCSRKEKGGQGFPDLHLFNLAMLARQGWRLHTNPESLCAQVLRAKYFPHGDLLAVKEKPGTPSVLFYMTPLTFFFNFDQYYLINQLVK